MAKRFDEEGSLPTPLKWVDWAHTHWRKRPAMAGLAMLACGLFLVGGGVKMYGPIRAMWASEPHRPVELTRVDPLPVRLYGSCYSEGRSRPAPDVALRLRGLAGMTMLARVYWSSSNGRDFAPIGTVNLWDKCDAGAPTCVVNVETNGMVFWANRDAGTKEDEAAAIYVQLEEGDSRVKIVSIGFGSGDCAGGGGGYGVQFPSIRLTTSRVL
jgi:hypothetical protein